MVNRDRLKLDYKRLVAVSPSTLQPSPSYQTWLLSPPLLPNPPSPASLFPSPRLRPNQPRLPIRVRNRVLRGAWRVEKAIRPLPSIQPSVQEQGQGLLRSRDCCRSSRCHHSLPTSGLVLTPLRPEYRRKVPFDPAGDILPLAGGSADPTQPSLPHPQTTRMRAAGEVGLHLALYISLRRY